MVDEEGRLVDAARRGDVEGFNALVRLYERRVYNLCYRMLGDADAAADVSQETFLSAYRNLRSFRGGVFRSWLLRIATNACYDALRAQKRRPTVSIDASDGDEDATPLHLVDSSPGPEDAVQRRELAAFLQRGLASLPEDQRAIVVLCDIEGLSYEEIAQITGVQLGTVKSRLSRGRGRLREILRAGELLPQQYRLNNKAI